jgi:hypothetical protein
VKSIEASVAAEVHVDQGRMRLESQGDANSSARTGRGSDL